MDRTVYHFRTKKRAEEVARILPRVFQGPVVGFPWKLEVRVEEGRIDGIKTWGVFLCQQEPHENPKSLIGICLEDSRTFVATRNMMHGWCRGYEYQSKRR